MQYNFTTAESKFLGQITEGLTGRHFIQITAIAGLTIIPEISADGGVTWNVRAVTPADNTADVTSMGAPGFWIMDVGTAWARLRSTGAGSATVHVQSAIG